MSRCIFNLHTITVCILNLSLVYPDIIICFRTVSTTRPGTLNTGTKK